ncbi:16S rRNA (uracil(1498)-N(3))-methyltransferase [Hydrogenophaga sp. OTU3427]|uniref:16S rRNA (uracil(1498)-N(3))-methyltransferase n=1 Tax=Hydrogenophaga sp. OTU3427 TaxID=3043856 RepID=UPI00313B235B
MPRFFCPTDLAPGAHLGLPEGAARHVQVLRLQPGDAITLFNGQGGEHEAVVRRMGRSEVEVEVGLHHAVEREPARAVTLAVGMPANERMDWLVEKATELGVARIQPLLTERCVLRLKGERAEKKVAHWQAVAVAACEQSGRNRVPQVAPVLELPAWLQTQSAEPGQRWVLSLREGVLPARERLDTDARALCVVAGPEGGLSAVEEDRLLAAAFAPASLGRAVLRAETAALAALVLAAG